MNTSVATKSDIARLADELSEPTGFRTLETTDPFHKVPADFTVRPASELRPGRADEIRADIETGFPALCWFTGLYNLDGEKLDSKSVDWNEMFSAREINHAQFRETPNAATIYNGLIYVSYGQYRPLSFVDGPEPYFTFVAYEDELAEITKAEKAAVATHLPAVIAAAPSWADLDDIERCGMDILEGSLPFTGRNMISYGGTAYLTQDARIDTTTGVVSFPKPPAAYIYVEEKNVTWTPDKVRDLAEDLAALADQLETASALFGGTEILVKEAAERGL